MFHLLLRICLFALNPAIVCSLQWCATTSDLLLFFVHVASRPSVQLGDAERWPNIELSLVHRIFMQNFATLF